MQCSRVERELGHAKPPTDRLPIGLSLEDGQGDAKHVSSESVVARAVAHFAESAGSWLPRWQGTVSKGCVSRESAGQGETADGVSTPSTPTVAVPGSRMQAEGSDRPNGRRLCRCPVPQFIAFAHASTL
jgi:hypothetical protein